MRKDFSSWIKEQIVKAMLVDGVDYITAQGLSSPISGSTKARPQKTIEYLISLDAAKQ